MAKRARIVLLMLTAMLLGIAGRLLYLAQTHPAQTAAGQSTYRVTAAQTRGTIYDTRMQPLVNAQKEYRAAVAPDAALLTALRGTAEPNSFDSLRQSIENGRPGVVRLNGPVALSDGLRLFSVPVRYGTRLRAPHVIGYTDGDGRGVTGIEKSFDALLSCCGGTASVVFTVDARGRYLAGAGSQIEDTTGRCVGGVVLTLDNAIQTAVEDAAAPMLPKGAVVVMDPYSGAIRASASFPSYQPDTVAQSIAADDGALVDRTLSLYDPGSVFKIVTAAAALENGIPADRRYTCAGSLNVQGTTFHCHNRLGHQRLTMSEAMARSCNLYFIQLAQEVGAQALCRTASDLGFARGVTVADEMAAGSAVLPAQEQLLSSPAALANLSFGQGYLLASPLHIAQLVSAVAADGVMPPTHLIEGSVDEQGTVTAQPTGLGQTVMTKSTAAALRTMLRGVLENGTGRAAASKLFTAAGKTGTAETGQKSTVGTKSVVQSWFAGYYPADTPRYVICVLAEDANNTNVTAAAVFRAVSEALFALQN